MALTDQEVADGNARTASISTRDGRRVKRVAAVRRRHSAELAMDTCVASRRDSAETRRDAGEACGSLWREIALKRTFNLPLHTR